MPKLTKAKRIKNELDRLNIYFELIDENQLAVVTSLIQNAAFMKVTLEDLQAIINAEGVIDQYQNGANQSGIKQSANLQAYNSLIKNYASVIRTLAQLLPPGQRKPRDLLEEFILSTNGDQEEYDREEEERERKVKEEIARGVELQKKQRERAQKGAKKTLGNRTADKV